MKASQLIDKLESSITEQFIEEFLDYTKKSSIGKTQKKNNVAAYNNISKLVFPENALERLLAKEERDEMAYIQIAKEKILSKAHEGQKPVLLENNRIFILADRQCWSPTKLLLTNKGLKMVKDITLEDKMIGEDGKEKAVTFKHSGYDLMYEVDGEWLTGDHILILEDDTEITVKEAFDRQIDVKQKKVYGFIYKITTPDNHYYIGSHKGLLESYAGSGKKIRQYYLNAGLSYKHWGELHEKAGFIKTIIGTAFNDEELRLKEFNAIDLDDPLCLNLVKTKHKMGTIKSHKAWNSGMTSCYSEEQKKRISDGVKLGHSKESSKRKQSEGQKRRFANMTSEEKTAYAKKSFASKESQKKARESNIRNYEKMTSEEHYKRFATCLGKKWKLVDGKRTYYEDN